jgi:ubiquitin-protein ligase
MYVCCLVLEKVVKLLSAPNPDDPAAADIAEKYKTDKSGYEKIASASPLFSSLRLCVPLSF